MIPVAYVNLFLAAVKQICEQTLNMPVAAGKPKLKHEDDRLWKLYQIAAVIHLDGAVRGVVSVCFSETVALALASKLADEQFKAMNDDSRDALGEVANLIVGTAKRGLSGGLVTISTPKIMSTYKVEACTAPAILLPFETAAGRFVIQMAIAAAPVPAVPASVA